MSRIFLWFLGGMLTTWIIVAPFVGTGRDVRFWKANAKTWEDNSNRFEKVANEYKQMLKEVMP